MVAFVIFWAAALAFLFFLLGIFFKALASAFNAITASGLFVLFIGFASGLVILTLFLIYGVVDELSTKGSGQVFDVIVLLAFDFFIIGGIVFALVGGFIALLFNWIVGMFEIVFATISSALEGIATLCGKGFSKFFGILIKNLDKC